MQKIPEDLHQPRAIAAYNFILPIMKSDDEIYVAGVCKWTDRFDSFAHNLLQRDGQLFHPHLAAKNRGHIEQVIDQSLQGVRVLLNHRKTVGHFLVRQNSIANHMNPANDWSQRGSQFMRNGGQKFVFGAAGRFGLQPSRTFFFKQTGVVDSQSDAVSDQLQQARVVFGKFVPRQSTDVHHSDNPSLDQQRHP